MKLKQIFNLFNSMNSQENVGNQELQQQPQLQITNGKHGNVSSMDTHTTTTHLQVEYQALYNECREHAAFFRHDYTEYGQRLYAAHIAWQDFIVLANQLVLEIEAFVHEYDFDDATPGNGFRSFLEVTNACIALGRNISAQLRQTRSTLFFRRKFYTKEVEACSQLLSSLCTCLQYLLILHKWSAGTGDLFANGNHTAEELFELGDTINQYSFYGRCLGFQYSDSIRGVLRFISIGMASYSETFYSQADDGRLLKTTRSLWTSSKYLMNPELRARRIVNISQNAKIEFCKSFWFLAESELMLKIPSIVGSSIKVNRMIEIPAELLQLPREHKIRSNNANAAEFVDIPVPTAHLGPGLPVSVRLLCAKRRAGMLGEGGSYRGWRKLAPPSSSILFHCHGGGFVAQSSASHELYLRDWAVALDVPILSIDYSLAPEAPFPRALEEVYYAYAWLLRNAASLGTTAEHIVCAGDSAGANLSIGLALKCIQTGIRIPDGIFLAYCPTLVSFVPSPARLLCLMDPLLPFGFMIRCLRAYAAPATETLNKNAKHVEEAAEVRNAAQTAPHYTLHLDKPHSVTSSRRTSCARSPLSSMADNSKWDQMQLQLQTADTATIAMEDDIEDSSYTFASASYHSQTVEHTDLPSTECDASSCVSFEDDSQPIIHYPVEINAETPKESTTAAYIDSFLDKYLIDTTTVGATESNAKAAATLTANGKTTKAVKDLEPMMAKTSSEENILIETGREMIAIDTLQSRIQDAINRIAETINRCTQSYEIHSVAEQQQNGNGVPDLRNIDALIARSPSEELGFNVPKDPFLSPYWACDEWLAQMPPTKILTLTMDPCLDDCVMFARKLKRLGCNVTLEILKGLPHGFLNFTMLSNEAMEGSKRCIKSLQELLQIPQNDGNDDAMTTANATNTPTTSSPSTSTTPSTQLKSTTKMDTH